MSIASKLETPPLTPYDPRCAVMSKALLLVLAEQSNLCRTSLSARLKALLAGILSLELFVVNFNNRARGGRGAGISTAGTARFGVSHNLDSLARGLGDLRSNVRDRLIRSSFKDALSPAQQEARRRTVHKGGYDLARPNLSGRVKRGISRKQPAPLQAEIKSVNSWPRLYNWSRNKSTTADYRGRGIKYSGLFRKSGTINRRRYAFVRGGLNNNAMVYGRQGDGRKPLFGFYGPNPSHVMLHKPVQEAARDVFHAKSEERFISKYQGAVDRIKSAHGL